MSLRLINSAAYRAALANSARFRLSVLQRPVLSHWSFRKWRMEYLPGRYKTLWNVSSAC
jgi:hypothetical protein